MGTDTGDRVLGLSSVKPVTYQEFLSVIISIVLSMPVLFSLSLSQKKNQNTKLYQNVCRISRNMMAPNL